MLGTLLIGAIIGLVCGFVGILAIGNYLAKEDKAKSKKALDELTNKLKAQTEQFRQDNKVYTESVKPRLERASQISILQADLIAAAQQPSKNALHSKHKNGLIGEIKDLEEEKTSILRSILNDGFNPDITATMEDGTRKMMPLKEYMEMLGMPTELSKEEARAQRKAKFTVIAGGKEDTKN